LSPSWVSVGIVFALSAASCGETRRDHQLDFYALGTEISISLFGVSDVQATRAADSLQSMFADVGHNWYPWRPGELQAINESLAEVRLPIDVSPRLATVIRRAAEIEILSIGRFNAGLGHLTELWGLHDVTNPPSALPDPAEIEARIRGGVGTELLDWDGDRIVGGRTFLLIDLGGIAKGAILEDSVQILRELGVNHAIVNIGGDLTVLGNVNGRPANIGIRSPVAEKPLASLDVAGGETVVTSGNYERYVEIDGQRYNHILDPQSGYPVEHTASVTVVHEDAMLTDAASTTLMVGGAKEFDALTDAMDIEFALLIDSSGDLRLTESMVERLHWLQD